jgi:uncharacterized OsmC-like protein
MLEGNLRRYSVVHRRQEPAILEKVWQLALKLRIYGFLPLELMAVSLAGCTAMDVISILRKKQQNVTAFSVSVDADRAIEHPKVFTQITILYYITGVNLDENASYVRSS